MYERWGWDAYVLGRECKQDGVYLRGGRARQTDEEWTGQYIDVESFFLTILRRCSAVIVLFVFGYWSVFADMGVPFAD